MNKPVRNRRLIIFDVDGTLYNQKKLRLFMMTELLLYYIVRPHKFYELNVIRHFRKEREKHATVPGDNIGIGRNQYAWCAEKVNRPVEEIERIIERWIHRKPLKYLKSCRYEHIRELMLKLQEEEITTAVYSDYRADKKIKAMDLSVDHIFTSEQPEIDRLKPDPKGVNYIIEMLGENKNDVLFVGDRVELDGACAGRAGVDYLHIERDKAGKIYAGLLKQLS